MISVATPEAAVFQLLRSGGGEGGWVRGNGSSFDSKSEFERRRATCGGCRLNKEGKPYPQGVGC